MELKSQRNSNFELLRIIAMLMIFWGHGMGVAQVQTGGGLFIRLAGDILGSGARISVTLFLLISAWFMVDMEYRMKRALDIWLETVFYVVIFSIVGYVVTPNASLFALVTSPFPLCFWQVWFPSAYIIWLLFMPVLREICQKLTDKAMLWYIMLHIVFFIVQASYNSLQDTHIVVIAWLNFLYCFVWFLKKNAYSPLRTTIYKKISPKWLVLVGISLYVVFAVMLWISNNFEFEIANRNVFEYAYKLLSLWKTDYKSLPNFLMALLIFLGVAGLKPNNCSVINGAAKSLFAIYCVHETLLFREYLWNNIFKLKHVKDYSIWILLSHIIIVTVVFFVLISLVDMLRRKYLHRFVVKSKAYLWICEKGDRIMNFNI